MAMEGVSKAAFEIYGTSSDAYGQSIDELFTETYFLEQWIVELLTLTRMRTTHEEVLLGKLSMVSSFMQESVLDMVLSDLQLLLQCYF
jgi:hypothetical protein